jgi:hypothetical protein
MKTNVILTNLLWILMNIFSISIDWLILYNLLHIFFSENPFLFPCLHQIGKFKHT